MRMTNELFRAIALLLAFHLLVEPALAVLPPRHSPITGHRAAERHVALLAEQAIVQSLLSNRRLDSWQRFKESFLGLLRLYLTSAPGNQPAASRSETPPVTHRPDAEWAHRLTRVAMSALKHTNLFLDDTFPINDTTLKRGHKTIWPSGEETGEPAAMGQLENGRPVRNEEVIDAYALFILVASGQHRLPPSQRATSFNKIRMMLREDTEYHDLNELALRTIEGPAVKAAIEGIISELRLDLTLDEALHLIAQWLDDRGRALLFDGWLRDMDPERRSIAETLFKALPLDHPVRLAADAYLDRRGQIAYLSEVLRKGKMLPYPRPVRPAVNRYLRPRLGADPNTYLLTEGALERPAVPHLNAIVNAASNPERRELYNQTIDQAGKPSDLERRAGPSRIRSSVNHYLRAPLEHRNPYLLTEGVVELPGVPHLNAIVNAGRRGSYNPSFYQMKKPEDLDNLSGLYENRLTERYPRGKNWWLKERTGLWYWTGGTLIGLWVLGLAASTYYMVSSGGDGETIAWITFLGLKFPLEGRLTALAVQLRWKIAPLFTFPGDLLLRNRRQIQSAV